MLMVLSPAKSLDYATPANTAVCTLPDFIADSANLIGHLRQLSPAQIASLMQISDSLATLNHGRYAAWSPEFPLDNAKQAIFAFNGDVYEGIDAGSFKPLHLQYAQSHFRILSGLYGVLRPLDLLQPYRLEMGTRLPTSRGKDLYAFWGERITAHLAAALHANQAKALVNLASEEYFKAVKPALLPVPVITPVFEDWKSGKYKIISFYAKRARGMMARYAALHGITEAVELKGFNREGYQFEPAASNDHTWVFRRSAGR